MDHAELWQNEAFRKAFQRWWDEDWSWEGLGKKYRQESPGHDPDPKLGTLLDMWRDVLNTMPNGGGRLIDFAGRQWTRFHLPPFDRDGNPCPADLWKQAKNARCNEVLEGFLKAAAAPEHAEPGKHGIWAVTKFAELRGVVFPASFAFDGDALVANLQSAIFVGRFAFSGHVVAQFDGATFSGEARFVGATFTRPARFVVATFSGPARFDGAMFSGDAWFTGATFTRPALFGRSTFSGEAWFGNVTFSEPAWFGGVTFAGDARFDSATFTRSARLEGARFSGDAWFEDATFSESVQFDNATFFGLAWFLRARFSGDAWFDSATFSGHALFAGTTPFAKGAVYRDTRFAGMADFSGRAFEEQTDFSEARFGGLPKFYGATLHPDTSFQETIFRGSEKGEPVRPRHNTEQDDEDEEGGDPKEYENAYRQLRILSRQIGSTEYEGMFHALELKAHRVTSDAQPLARIVSWLYEYLSDFGRSLGVPFVWLFVAWEVFATLYLLTMTPPYHAAGPRISELACANIGLPDWFSVIVTVAHEFLPGLFGATSIANQPQWLRCGEGAHPFLFFLFNISQVVIFITLITLFLIALRRRFQMRG